MKIKNCLENSANAKNLNGPKNRKKIIFLKKKKKKRKLNKLWVVEYDIFMRSSQMTQKYKEISYLKRSAGTCVCVSN